MKKNDLLKKIVENIDLKRIKDLPVSEKFKLYEHIKLIYTEAEYASKEGIPALVNSPNYTINPTYNLFAMLIVNLSDFDLIKSIVENYLGNFETSDIYYAQIAVTGMGLLMVEKQFSPESIYHFLLNLLGYDFMLDNIKLNGSIGEVDTLSFKLDTSIEYKPFEGEHRQFKYDILALLKLSHDKGKDYTYKLIDDKFPGSRLQLYLNLLKGNSEAVSDFIFQDLKAQDIRSSRLIATGAYAIYKGEAIISTHYLLNSVLGKYSRFDKRKEEIDQEIDQHIKGLI